MDTKTILKELNELIYAYNRDMKSDGMLYIDIKMQRKLIKFLKSALLHTRDNTLKEVRRLLEDDYEETMKYTETWKPRPKTLWEKQKIFIEKFIANFQDIEVEPWAKDYNKLTKDLDLDTSIIIADFIRSLLVQQKEKFKDNIKQDLDFASDKQYSEFAKGYREAISDILKLIEERVD